MKPPFFVCSRPYRAHSFAGENGPQRASFFPPPQESQKGSSQTIPHPSLIPQCRDVSPLIVPLFIRGSLSSSQARQPSVQSPQPALLKSRPARVPSQGWQKNRKLFAQTRELSSGNAQLFPESRDFILERTTFSRITRLLLWNGTTSLQHSTISFAAPLDFFCVSSAHSPLTLQRASPSLPSSPPTSSSLCLPSVNSLSTTTAAP